ncbi:unnamed protein product [Eruca vesicaria subsp. sativa]|uniref:Phototropic-responsive NPH3 family protein n=1 Tax=Eruca vesicaria subsp. sativa TaxID=29727 RepID=A0ABC8LJ39_ERUVS|nr:unnamed protein product [Eruca vesicaria subsp. sativa]
MAMEACSDLEVDINGKKTIFLNKKVICKFSETLRKLLGKTTCSSNGNNIKVIFKDFPGGAESFELVTRFCYSNGHFTVVPSNLVLFHCAAKFMEVTTVLEQTEKCIEEIRYWTWSEVLLGLKQCQELETSSDTDSLAAKLMDALVEKLCLVTEASPSSAASACSPSPDSSSFRFSCDSKSTESFKNSSSRIPWWFDEVLVLSPGLVKTFLKLMITGRFDNLTITKFLFYYQKVKFCSASCNEKREILETTIDTLYVLDRSCVPYKSLFGVLRLAFGLNINKGVMNKLELMIGQQLDQATLDNLLVPSPLKSSHLYYVNLVLRFAKAFLDEAKKGSQLKKVARLVDQYIAEVAPDPFLKPSKFLSLLMLIPDSARESHEDIYRAIDMYLEAHAGLTNGEQLNLIRTLSYDKLSTESRAHILRNAKFQAIQTQDVQQQHKQLILQVEKVDTSGDNEKLKEHIEGIQWRVMELERACLKMQTQMEVIKKRSKSTSRGSNRSLPTLCS